MMVFMCISLVVLILLLVSMVGGSVAMEFLIVPEVILKLLCRSDGFWGFWGYTGS